MSMKSNSFKIRVRKSRFFMEKIKPFSQLQRVQLCSEQRYTYPTVLYISTINCTQYIEKQEKNIVYLYPLPPISGSIILYFCYFIFIL